MVRASAKALALAATFGVRGSTASNFPQSPAEVHQLDSDASVQKTVKGCRCKSNNLCGAKTDAWANCDYCRTEDHCGHFSLNGYWDYCVYPANDSFESQNFQDKIDYFWSQIQSDASHTTYPNVLGIVAESIQTTFDNWQDVMPEGRKKYIHSVGAVCPFDLEIADGSPYTGLLGPGVQKGFIRMGSAADPVQNKGVTPGLGFNFQRSGVHSGAFVALHSLDLGQSFNFFAYNQSNHIAPPTGATAILAKKFNQASQCAPQVGLSDLAAYSQDGTAHAQPWFPFKLFLVVNPDAPVQQSDAAKTLDEVLSGLTAIPAGTTLYTVYACDTPASDKAEMTPTDGGLETACGSPMKLGAIKTTDKCVTSLYGDTKFQIRHQRVEEDWAKRPEFLNMYDAAAACGHSVSLGGTPKTCAQQDEATSEVVV